MFLYFIKLFFFYSSTDHPGENLNSHHPKYDQDAHIPDHPSLLDECSPC